MCNKFSRLTTAKNKEKEPVPKINRYSWIDASRPCSRLVGYSKHYIPPPEICPQGRSRGVQRGKRLERHDDGEEKSHKKRSDSTRKSGGIMGNICASLTVVLLSHRATSFSPHWKRTCASCVVATTSVRYLMMASLSVFGIPTILVTKPGLKNRLFQPVTGFVRIKGCSVVICSRRTVRPRARESDACMLAV